MEVPTLTVGTSPHWRTKTSITTMNVAFIVALCPAALVGAIAHSFGPNATAMKTASGPFAGVIETLVVEMGLNTGILWLSGIFGMIALGMALGILTEYVCQIVMRQPYHAANGHGALIGFILVMLMPPTVPLWVLVVGVVVAIFLGKQVFGGIGGYPMHPAIVGWLVLLLSWPNHLYPVGMESIAAVHLAPILATAAGGVALLMLGYIRWQIPVGVIGGVVVFSLIFQADLANGGGLVNGGGLANGQPASIVDQLLRGHVVLAAFFLATDSTSSPANKLAKLIYGFGTGFLIVLIRAYGIWPDAVPFAILLMNVMSPLLDRIRRRVKKVVIQNG